MLTEIKNCFVSLNLIGDLQVDAPKLASTLEKVYYDCLVSPTADCAEKMTNYMIETCIPQATGCLDYVSTCMQQAILDGKEENIGQALTSCADLICDKVEDNFEDIVQMLPTLESTNTGLTTVIAALALCATAGFLFYSSCKSSPPPGPRTIRVSADGLPKFGIFGGRGYSSITLRGSDITDEGLSVLAERCPNLISVDLRDCQNVTNEGLMELAQQCSKLASVSHDLASLDLQGCDEMTDAVLQAFIHPNITSANLHGCAQITDLGLLGLAKRCPELTSVNIQDCNQISDVQLLAKRCPKLTAINLRGTQITDAQLADLALQSPNLTEINLQGCQQITCAGLRSLAQRCPKLTSVLHDLTTLDLSECHQVANETLLAFAHDKITEVSLEGCDQIVDPWISEWIARCSSITSINLLGCYVTNTGLMQLAGVCKNLTSIKLGGPHISNSTLAFLRFCRFSSIHLQDCKITDGGLVDFARHFPGLTSVNLQGCTGISDACVVGLAQTCHDLRIINLQDCPKAGGDNGLQALADNCPELREVNLRRPGQDGWVTPSDQGLSALAQCSNLTSVNLEGCVAITDIGISDLAKGCPNLTSVNLNGCMVSNPGVVALAENCSNLNSIDLNNLNITQEGLEVLAKHCPNLIFISLPPEIRSQSWLLALPKNWSRLFGEGIQVLDCRNITEEHLKFWPERSCLTHIIFAGCNEKLLFEILENLVPRCPLLTHACLEEFNYPVVSDALRYLRKQCPKLNTVNIADPLDLKRDLITLNNFNHLRHTYQDIRFTTTS